MVINLTTNRLPHSEQEHPLILTLKLDRKTFLWFDQLRQQYFPASRNLIPAHVTLFHQLPAQQQALIQASLNDRCTHTPPISLRFPGLRFLGQGVAAEIEAIELVQLRQQLAKQWQNGLTRQDQQGYRPHITIQNKVTADQARQLYHQLTSDWQEIQGQGEGLLLWRYLNGPWQLIQEFTFRGVTAPAPIPENS